MFTKIKKMILPMVLGLGLFAGASTPFNDIALNSPVEVYASKTSDASGMPDIKFDASGNLNMGDMKDKNNTALFNTVLEEYRTVVIFISGIGTVSMILFFILNFINLGKSQGNPQERQKAITGLIISGIASAGLGSVTLITTLFYNVLGKDGGK